jgi:hypothetical protein
MISLRQIIKEELLLEKRIAQIAANLEINYLFDVDRTSHAFDRAVRHDIPGYNDRPIVNAEIKEIVSQASKEIAENIANQRIKEGEDFVVKSLKWELAMAIAPVHVEGMFWRLHITTVFRESKYDPFRTGKNQLVINV